MGVLHLSQCLCGGARPVAAHKIRKKTQTGVYYKLLALHNSVWNYCQYPAYANENYGFV